MSAILLASLAIAAPAALADLGCGEGCVLRIADLCVYQIPNPPFFEVRPCPPLVQSLKLG
jgi:hypothetical protein